MSRREEFPQTRWSLILEAGTANPQALATLCQDYWHPLYVYARREGSSVEDAEDLTQSFFAYILSKDFFQQAQPERGRLRTLLLRSFKNFRVSTWRKEHSKKRGGDTPFIEIDAASAEAELAQDPVDDLTPELEYERHWAREVLRQAKAKLLETYTNAGKLKEYETFEDQLEDGKAERSYTDMAKDMGVAEPAARFMAFKMRQRYRECLTEIVTETVATQEEAKDELAHLLNVFR